MGSKLHVVEANNNNDDDNNNNIDDNNSKKYIVLDDKVNEYNNIFNTINIQLFMTGDLKYYFQCVGRDNMETNWCLWCKLSSEQWMVDKDDRNIDNYNINFKEDGLQTWTLERIGQALITIEALPRQATVDE